MPNEPPNGIVDIALGLIVLDVTCAFALLGREVSRPPRRIRAGLIVLTFLLTALITLQLATGYYLAFAGADMAARAGVPLLYVAATVPVLTGKRMAWRVNRIVGSMGIAIPGLFFLRWLIMQLGGGIVVIGLSNPIPVFQGRIAQGSSYSITVDQTLIGNGSYYRYTVYHNPPWLPVVRKKAIDGPIYGCGVAGLCSGREPRPQRRHMAGLVPAGCRIIRHGIDHAEEHRR